MKAHKDSLSEVIIATDPDREGELIGEHALQEILAAAGGKKTGVPVKSGKGGKGKPPAVAFSRAYMQSITPEGIEAALRARTANSYNTHLASAAMTRHVLDRLFGYFGSAMVQSCSRLRSVGRVQTPALIIIHDREAAHDEFLRTRASTFGLTAKASFGPEGSIGETAGVVSFAGGSAQAAPGASAPKKKARGRKGGKAAADAAAESAKEDGADDATAAAGAWAPTTIESAKAVADLLQSSDAAEKLAWSCAAAAEPTSRTTEPPQPLTLPALMLRMGKKTRMGSEEVTRHCQQLFTDGLITYPRTDSVRIEAGPAEDIKAFIRATFGASEIAADAEIAERLSGEKPKGGKGKGKGAKAAPSNVEDAHEALRPTSISNAAPHVLDPGALAVYNEIRLVAMQAFMKSAVHETVTFTFSAPLGPLVAGAADATLLPPADTSITCRVSATRLATPGFLQAEGSSGGEDQKVFDYLSKSTSSSSPVFQLHSFKAVERRAAPPPLYFEGALIEELKRLGIGRPSTYPTILATLKNRGYVTVDPATAKIRTTAEGRELVSIARRFFPLFVDLGFTSRMERTLDAIVRADATPDTLLSSVHRALLSAAREVAVASFFADGEDRKANATKRDLVEGRIPPLVTQTKSSPPMAFDEYCQRVRAYLRRNMKPGTATVGGAPKR